MIRASERRNTGSSSTSKSDIVCDSFRCPLDCQSRGAGRLTPRDRPDMAAERVVGARHVHLYDGRPATPQHKRARDLAPHLDTPVVADRMPVDHELCPSCTEPGRSLRRLRSGAHPRGSLRRPPIDPLFVKARICGDRVTACRQERRSVKGNTGDTYIASRRVMRSAGHCCGSRCRVRDVVAGRRE
jgi:hypothetical protein